MSIFRIPYELSKKLAHALAPDLYVHARARYRAIVGPASSHAGGRGPSDLERRIGEFERRVDAAASEGRIEPRVAERLQHFVAELRTDMADDPTGLR